MPTLCSHLNLACLARGGGNGTSSFSICDTEEDGQWGIKPEEIGINTTCSEAVATEVVPPLPNSSPPCAPQSPAAPDEVIGENLCHTPRAAPLRNLSPACRASAKSCPAIGPETFFWGPVIFWLTLFSALVSCVHWYLDTSRFPFVLPAYVHLYCIVRSTKDV